MSELQTFLVALVGELATDLVPLIEKLVEGAAAGRSPVEVLADESVVDILPPQFKTMILIASQRAKYAPPDAP